MHYTSTKRVRCAFCCGRHETVLCPLVLSLPEGRLERQPKNGVYDGKAPVRVAAPGESGEASIKVRWKERSTSSAKRLLEAPVGVSQERLDAARLSVAEARERERLRARKNDQNRRLTFEERRERSVERGRRARRGEPPPGGRSYVPRGGKRKAGR